MYKTKTNDELLKQYDPSNIGRRIFHRLDEVQLSMRDFEAFLIRLFPSPFSNLRKYIPYSEIKSTVRADRRRNSFYENLGNFALSYAITMYAIAFVLKTDTYYLVSGHEYEQFRNYLPLFENETRNMNEHITDIQQSLMSSYCLDECGARLRICREKRNLTIKQLADRIKISPSTVYGYENSNSSDLPRYSYPLLFKISEILQVPTDFIILGYSILKLYHIPIQQLTRENDELEFNPPIHFDIRELYKSLWEEMKIEAVDAEGIEEYISECEQQYRDDIRYILPMLKIDMLEKIKNTIKRDYPDFDSDRFLSEDKRKYTLHDE